MQTLPTTPAASKVAADRTERIARGRETDRVVRASAFNDAFHAIHATVEKLIGQIDRLDHAEGKLYGDLAVAGLSLDLRDSRPDTIGALDCLRDTCAGARWVLVTFESLLYSHLLPLPDEQEETPDPADAAVLVGVGGGTDLLDPTEAGENVLVSLE